MRVGELQWPSDLDRSACVFRCQRVRNAEFRGWANFCAWDRPGSCRIDGMAQRVARMKSPPFCQYDMRRVWHRHVFGAGVAEGGQVEAGE